VFIPFSMEACQRNYCWDFCAAAFVEVPLFLPNYQEFHLACSRLCLFYLQQALAYLLLWFLVIDDARESAVHCFGSIYKIVIW
jgi:hypothetical protein